jgi:O-antigen biosynthesis protein WbqV
VPLVEGHPIAGVQTNVLGTRNVADAARRHGARAMVQVSTDKAVNPVGFMGVTKRLGELYCQALDLEGRNRPNAPRFMTVRFGNVLGSSGSLIPLFQRQLSRGGPLTVTHPDIERFFMTVHEAVQLVLHSAARGLGEEMSRGRIFVLDMGDPVRVIDIARRMIRLAGLEPDFDVDIEIVGLRPGEKLFEELFDTQETRLPSVLPGIFEAASHVLPGAVLQRAFDELEEACARNDDDACRAIALSLLTTEVETNRQSAQIRAEQPRLLTPAAV